MPFEHESSAKRFLREITQSKPHQCLCQAVAHPRFHSPVHQVEDPVKKEFSMLKWTLSTHRNGLIKLRQIFAHALAVVLHEFVLDAVDSALVRTAYFGMRSSGEQITVGK